MERVDTILERQTKIGGWISYGLCAAVDVKKYLVEPELPSIV